MNSLVLQCHNGALVTQDPAVSPGTLGSMGHHSVTIVPSVPKVLAMEQWPLDAPGPFSVTIITESRTLEKSFECIKPNP